MVSKGLRLTCKQGAKSKYCISTRTHYHMQIYAGLISHIRAHIKKKKVFFHAVVKTKSVGIPVNRKHPDMRKRVCVCVCMCVCVCVCVCMCVCVVCKQRCLLSQNPQHEHARVSYKIKAQVKTRTRICTTALHFISSMV